MTIEMMTPEDCETIKRESKTTRNALIFFGSLTAICILITIRGSLSASYEWQIYGIIAGTIFLILSLIFFWNYHKDFMDLTAKKKELIKGAIDDKVETHGEYGHYYHFSINNQALMVDVTSYTRFDKGDIVQVHIARNSRRVVKVEKAK